MFYLFPLILPYTKGNVVKTFIIGLVALVIGLYFVTDMAPDFTKAANDVFATTGDSSAHIPVKSNGTQYQAGAMDFASSLFGWSIYKFTAALKYAGAAILTIITIAMVWWNRRRIVAEEHQSK